METHSFIPTKRAIFCQKDLEEFWKSNTYQTIKEFINSLGTAAKGKANDYECTISTNVERIIQMLEMLDKWIEEIPAIQQPMRYGNKAYRIWNERLVSSSESLCRDLLPDDCKDAAVEICAYLNDSFGNQTRIDYGTGHECTFILWLCCLYQMKVLTDDDLTSCVIKVFVKYITVCRNLQKTYWLEPAGSHGVWSLDDYQMLVFYFGAAQLIGNPHIKPKSINDDDILIGFSNKYLYIGAIHFITQVKSGKLYENSPILYDVSGVPKWDKVMSGMFKMFEEEVLHKFPVIQHFRFGSLLKCEWTPSENPDTKEEYGRVAPPTDEEIKANEGNTMNTNIRLPPVAHIAVDKVSPKEE